MRPGTGADVGEIVEAVETAQQCGLSASCRTEENGHCILVNSHADAAQRFGTVGVLEGEIVDFDFHWLIYHCLFALARERITVAITFMVSTKASRTNAVPYWIWIGISGTWVEITNR
jgi:hypothetical protein